MNLINLKILYKFKLCGRKEDVSYSVDVYYVLVWKETPYFWSKAIIFCCQIKYCTGKILQYENCTLQQIVVSVVLTSTFEGTTVWKQIECYLWHWCSLPWQLSGNCITLLSTGLILVAIGPNHSNGGEMQKQSCAMHWGCIKELQMIKI